jgi:hypothetical protein
MLISCAHRCVEQVGGNRVVRRKVASPGGPSTCRCARSRRRVGHVLVVAAVVGGHRSGLGQSARACTCEARAASTVRRRSDLRVETGRRGRRQRDRGASRARSDPHASTGGTDPNGTVPLPSWAPSDVTRRRFRSWRRDGLRRFHRSSEARPRRRRSAGGRGAGWTRPPAVGTSGHLDTRCSRRPGGLDAVQRQVVVHARPRQDVGVRADLCVGRRLLLEVAFTHHEQVTARVVVGGRVPPAHRGRPRTRGHDGRSAGGTRCRATLAPGGF